MQSETPEGVVTISANDPSPPRRYDPHPYYPASGGRVHLGWEPLCAELPDRSLVIALDGPAILDWERAIADVSSILERSRRSVRSLDLRAHLAPWQRILELTTTAALAEDPNFEMLAGGSLADLFIELPHIERPGHGVLLIYGPGAALIDHDRLWYLDLPKRYAEAAIAAGEARNLAQPPEAGAGTTRRLFYVDWPLLDRHRDGLLDRIDHWVDLQNPESPRSLDGITLRGTLTELARRPFRTRPTFNTVSWGGHWGQRQLGMNPEARNTGIGYELIAPESGVLIGADPESAVEVPFALIAAHRSGELLGPVVERTFGASFPIRFDYLDTVDGGNLSVHCHPQADYMRSIFGWPYTQHETYYVMVGGARSRVFLGLRDDVDVDDFHRAALDASEQGVPFEIEHYVQTFAATPHQLFAIPAGTPHGSGVGNVVLEVSATPYLYSLRFYDWLRRDNDGTQRPVHIEHAFANLNLLRAGAAVRAELVRPPAVLRSGDGWREEVLAAVPEMFFDVRRLVLESDVPLEDETSGRFHVLNLVDGEGAVIETDAGHVQDLAYAETMIVPAAVGRYRVQRSSGGTTRLVKALVR